ncbi:MAG TPA: L,D-transpeptidase family protein, partial [Acidimicrobiales bacterium]|nr:L,D-transpeptidase family protein [Acidimicrobiales bacterium]
MGTTPVRGRRRATLATRAPVPLLAVVLAFAGCGRISTPAADSPAPSTPASTAQAPVPPPSVPSLPPQGLGAGDRGEHVRAVEARLQELHFDVGTVDGVFDDDTAFAVQAFQKVAGLSRDGRVSATVLERLNAAQPPPPLVPGGGRTRVEIDLPRQVLFLYENDALSRVLPVSTGTGKRFCSKGDCGVAVTPAGAFRVDYWAPGWQESRLGRLYNPVYIFPRKGIAIHGFAEVPPQPASHGCVRIPMSAAEWFPDKVPKGTPSTSSTVRLRSRPS